MEPLFDLGGRTVCLTYRTPLESLIDALLRMHAGDDWQSPITLYVGFSSRGPRWLGAMDALQICDILHGLRSEVHTIGSGLMQGFEPLVLAAGKRGKRFLLRNSLVRVGPLVLEELPLPGTDFGLGAGRDSASMRDQAHSILSGRIHRLIGELAVDQKVWQSDQLLTADQALRLGLADHLAPVLPHLPEHHHARRNDFPLTYESPVTSDRTAL
jgi:ATP-dependent protease ClpP protease subunit